ncbi:MAG TPA: DUF4238 domain-containing protein [Gemmatimonadaceae bacterium]|nr:DUF4238 domain-containing protein [Gemmatimonadaceae bacterium]
MAKPTKRQAAKPRRHHHFPQFHLAHFADARLRLWAYDKRGRLEPNPKPIPLAALAVEANLYDDDAPSGNLEGVEEWLANSVDGPASIVVRKVISAQSITQQERETLGRYVMSRDLRTPATRDFLMKRAQAGVEADYDARVADTAQIRQAILEDSNVDVSERQVAALAKAYRPVVTKGFWLEFMQKHTIRALPRLLAKGWTLFRADDGCEFVTSDVGILKHRGGWDRPAPSKPGWWDNADGWLMPLTPHLMLAMAPGLYPGDKLVQRAFLDPFNRAIAQQAREFVFAQSESELRRAIDMV